MIFRGIITKTIIWYEERHETPQGPIFLQTLSTPLKILFYSEDQIVDIQPTQPNLSISFFQTLQHMSSCLTSQYVEGTMSR